MSKRIPGDRPENNVHYQSYSNINIDCAAEKWRQMS